MCVTEREGEKQRESVLGYGREENTVFSRNIACISI